MIEVDDRHIDASSSASPVRAGEQTPGATALAEKIVAALRTVFDPEIPVNVYDLGLIYRIESKQQNLIEIDMTLTAPGCPVAGEMLSMVERAVATVDGVETVNVNLVFDPPWDKSKMSEDVQLELGLI